MYFDLFYRQVRGTNGHCKRSFALFLLVQRCRIVVTIGTVLTEREPFRAQIAVSSAIRTVCYFSSFHYQLWRCQQASRVLTSFADVLLPSLVFVHTTAATSVKLKLSRNDRLIFEDGTTIAERDEILEQYCLARTSFRFLAGNLWRNHLPMLQGH